MTFKDARQAALADFDLAVINIRYLISRPGFVNLFCMDLTNCLKRFNSSLERVRKINEVEKENVRAET